MQTDDVLQALHRLGGCARTGQLLRAGATRTDLRHAVASGAVLDLRKGVLGSATAPRALLDAARHGGEVACATAARIHGIWTLAPDDLHVWIGPHGRSHPHAGCACVVHHDAGSAGLGVVSPARALVQMHRCCGDEAFFAALESALNSGVIGDPERDWIRERLHPSGRWLVDFAHAASDSGLESFVRLRLHRLGITVRAQVAISNVGIVDFVIGDRLILEVDGRENHDGPSKRHKDLVRDANAAVRGYVTLRFDYAMVVHDWPLVEAAILRALTIRP